MRLFFCYPLSEGVIGAGGSGDEELSVAERLLSSARLGGFSGVNGIGVIEAEPVIVIEARLGEEPEAVVSGGEGNRERLLSPVVEIRRGSGLGSDGGDKCVVLIDFNLRAGLAGEMEIERVTAGARDIHEVLRPRAGGHILEHKQVRVGGRGHEGEGLCRLVMCGRYGQSHGMEIGAIEGGHAGV